jgi:putative addiction module CopG family antidote
MQRVNLGKPYEEFIKKLVEAGYYASASEVLRDALRTKMEQSEKWQKKRLLQLVQKGLDDVEAGGEKPFNEELMKQAFEQAQKNILEGKEIPDYLRP